MIIFIVKEQNLQVCKLDMYSYTIPGFAGSSSSHVIASISGVTDPTTGGSSFEVG